MTNSETYYTDLISRYFYGEATPEEIRDLEIWVKADPAHLAIFREYQAAWKITEEERMDSSIDLNQEWNLLASRLKTRESTVDSQTQTYILNSEIVNHKSKFAFLVLRVAAIFLLLAIPAYFLFKSSILPAEKQLTASVGLVEETLPDGTVVTLNKGATITYPSHFKGSQRQVALKGEAWFEVAHDRSMPFIISSENVRIRVVGTTFFVNTNSSAGAKEVILSSGVVKVYYEDHPQTNVYLLPGQKAELVPGNHFILKSTNADVNYLAWKTKHIIFNNTSLTEAVAVISGVYHTDILLCGDGLNNCRITATFDRQSLESVLNVLKATLNLQVSKTGKGIELSGNGCEQTR